MNNMNLALALSVICFALCIVLFFYFRWYIRQRSAANELLAEYRTEVQKLIADIDFATDRDSLLVEERIKTLKDMLEDTDKRIAVYIKELERSRSGEAMYAKLGLESRIADRVPVAEPAIVESAAGAPDAAGMSQTAVTGKRAAVPYADPVSFPEPAEKPDLRMQIAELAVQGHSSVRIASKLKISVSEVELILNLLRK